VVPSPATSLVAVATCPHELCAWFERVLDLDSRAIDAVIRDRRAELLVEHDITPLRAKVP
jgi:hypothetical protein